MLIMLLCLDLLIVAVEVLAASELLKHHHLVLSLIRGLLKKACLLLLLSEIDDVSPPLLILCLEVLEELIETLIALCHGLDGLVERLAWLGLVLLNEALQLLNLLDRAGSHYCLLFLWLRIREEEHLAFLILILGGIHENVIGSESLLGHSEHVYGLILMSREHKLHSREVFEHIY